MVEGVRARGIGTSSPVVRDGIKSAGSGFSVGDGAEPLIQNTRLSSVVALGLENMLALQAVDDAGERDRGARKRGAAIIAALTNLQRAMLAGDDPALTTRALGDLAADDAIAGDPGLAAILRAIVLRARVEAARGKREE